MVADDSSRSGKNDPAAQALRDRFARSETQVPTSRLSRLWRTGRGAAGLAGAVLRGRLHGEGEGVTGRDLEAVARLTARLGELKGITMKAGQMLGYVDLTLPPEIRGLLSILQTSSPATPFAAIEATLRECFGPGADALLRGLEPAPIAVASIGQVHRGTLPDGTRVAVKVRHPGIQAAIRSDFANAGAGAAVAQLLAGAGTTVKSFVDEARTALLEECDFELEAKRQSTFRELFAEHPSITVPAVEPAWCAPAVLTTHWTPGRSLDELSASNPPAAVRDRLGVALFEFYVGTLYRHGLFHADPHPGNYAFPEDGGVVIYDFGCVRQFDAATVAAFARLAHSVRTDAPAAMAAALRDLGATPPQRPADVAHLRLLLRGFFAPLLIAGPRPMDPGTGFGAATELLRDKRALMRLALPGSLLFMFRLRFGLYAVLARLGATADWGGMEERWASEIGAARSGRAPK